MKHSQQKISEHALQIILASRIKQGHIGGVRRVMRAVVGRRIALLLNLHDPQHHGKGEELSRRMGHELKGGKSSLALKASRRYVERTGSPVVYKGLCLEAS